MGADGACHWTSVVKLPPRHFLFLHVVHLSLDQRKAGAQVGLLLLDPLHLGFQRFGAFLDFISPPTLSQRSSRNGRGGLLREDLALQAEDYATYG